MARVKGGVAVGTSRLHNSATRPHARDRLRDEIERAQGLVSGDFVTYLDTVIVLLRYDVSVRARADIAKCCGSLHYGPSQASGYPHRMALSQPQPAALELIEEHLDHIVTVFHSAIDVPTQSTDDAAALTSTIQHLAIQPWHGDRKSRLVEQVTSYASEQRRTPRNFAIYGDRSSKRTGEACCHIELRYDGARACQVRGVRTCADLLKYDHFQYIDRDVKLGLINWRLAFQILRRQHLGRRPVTRQALIQKTFRDLSTPRHAPSFSDPPIVPTQLALEVVPAWRLALICTSLSSVLYARTRVHAGGHSDYQVRMPPFYP